MAVRFDLLSAKVSRKPSLTQQGFLRVDANVARAGILRYRNPDGSVRRELRLPEENEKVLPKFGFLPVTLEHPPELVNSKNSKQYQVGMSGQQVFYSDDQFVTVALNITDEKTVASVLNQDTVDISAGYTCNLKKEPGVWNGEPYDAIQVDILPDHLAVTQEGRAGREVSILGIRADSMVETYGTDDVAFGVDYLDFSVPKKDSKKEERRMAVLKMDSVEYDGIPEVAASVMGAKLKKYEELQARYDALLREKENLESSVGDLESDLETAEEDKDTATGRADAYEAIATSAVPILNKAGYLWDKNQEVFVFNSDGKKTDEDDEDEDDEDEDGFGKKKKDGGQKRLNNKGKSLGENLGSEEDEDGGEEDEMMPPKRKKKDMSSKKKDMGDKTKQDMGGKKVNKDSVESLLQVWRDAEYLGVEKYDSALTVPEVQALTIQIYEPDFDPEVRTDSYIDGKFQLLLDSVEDDSSEEDTSQGQRFDSIDFTNGLQSMLNVSSFGASGISNGTSNPQDKSNDFPAQVGQAWQSPLTLSR